MRSGQSFVVLSDWRHFRSLSKTEHSVPRHPLCRASGSLETLSKYGDTCILWHIFEKILRVLIVSDVEWYSDASVLYNLIAFSVLDKYNCFSKDPRTPASDNGDLYWGRSIWRQWLPVTGEQICKISYDSIFTQLRKLDSQRQIGRFLDASSPCQSAISVGFMSHSEVFSSAILVTQSCAALNFSLRHFHCNRAFQFVCAKRRYLVSPESHYFLDQSQLYLNALQAR